jgi:hypothetical protein
LKLNVNCLFVAQNSALIAGDRPMFSELQESSSVKNTVTVFWAQACFLHGVRSEFTDDVSEIAVGPNFTEHELELLTCEFGTPKPKNSINSTVEV